MDVAHNEEQSDGNGDGDGSNGDRGGKAPKQISLTDPQAAWVIRKGIDQFFAYDANYLIDNKAGIILDEGARANRKEEIAITHPWWTASSIAPRRSSPLPTKVCYPFCRWREALAAPSQ